MGQSQSSDIKAHGSMTCDRSYVKEIIFPYTSAGCMFDPSVKINGVSPSPSCNCFGDQSAGLPTLKIAAQDGFYGFETYADKHSGRVVGIKLWNNASKDSSFEVFIPGFSTESAGVVSSGFAGYGRMATGISFSGDTGGFLCDFRLTDFISDRSMKVHRIVFKA